MDEFTVRIELYKGRRTHKKNLLLSSLTPPPTPHDLLALSLAAPQQEKHSANTEVAAGCWARSGLCLAPAYP